MPASDNPHDTLFKELLAQPSDAAGEFEAVLPPELFRLLDPATLVPVPTSFVDEALRRFYSDRLFRAKLRGRPAYVYLLVEHKSEPERFTLFQLLRYMVRIWEQELARPEAPRCLPPVIPLILHHGEQGWTAPKAFHGLFDAELMKITEVAGLTPSFEVVLDDLREQTDEQIQARSMRAFAQMGLLLLRDARRLKPAELLSSLGRWGAMMGEVARAPDGRRALLIILGYIARAASDIDPAELTKTIKQAIPEAEDALATMAERWLEQGFEKGQAATLIRLLTRKFGDVDQAWLTRVNAANTETLARYTDRLLSAQAVEDVFQD